MATPFPGHHGLGEERKERNGLVEETNERARKRNGLALGIDKEPGCLLLAFLTLL
jgi:hypothetical protein